MQSTKYHSEPEIIGKALKEAREQKNIAQAELANLCCLSTKMISELEEGGLSSFYTFQLKIATAKRVGNFLGLDESTYLLRPNVEMSVEDASLAAIETKETSDSKKLGISIAASDIKTPLQKHETTKSTDPSSPQLPNLEELLNEGSGNHGLELNPSGEAPSQTRVIAVLFGFLLLSGALYGLNERFNLVNSASQLINPPPIVVVNDAQDLKTDADLPPKSDSPEVVLVAPEVKSVQASLSPPDEQCPYKQEAQLSSYQSPNPSKRGDVVNIKSLIKQAICVVDSSGKQTVVNLEPNTSSAFRGSSPFVVMTQDLDNVEMYFQGWRVRAPNPGAKQIKLLEVAL